MNCLRKIKRILQTLILVFLIGSSLVVSINYLYHPLVNNLSLDDEIGFTNEINQEVSSDSLSSSISSGGEQTVTVDNHLGQTDYPSKTEEENYQDPIDTEQWYEGESVNVTVSYPSTIAEIEDAYVEGLEGDKLEFISYPFYIGADNSVFAEIRANDTIDDDDLVFDILVEIYTGKAGLLYYDFYGSVNSSTAQTSLCDDEFSINYNYYDGLGYTKLWFTVEAFNSASQTNIEASLRVLNFETMGYSLIEQSGYSYFTPESPIDYASLFIDQLSFTPNNLTYNKRAQYQYKSENTISHVLTITNYELAATISIKAPLAWNLSIIDPLTTYSLVSNDYEFYNIKKGDYRFSFFSGVGWGRDYARQAQYLAISDHSLEYMKSPGFEGGSPGEITSVAQSFSEGLSMSTSIVKEGAFSLKGEDTDANDDTFDYETDYRGPLYFGFSYYYVSSSNPYDYIRVYWRIDDSTWDYQEIEIVENRWQDIFCYFELLGTEAANSRNIVIHLESGDGEFYLDDLFFGKSNAKAVTTNYGEITLSAQMIGLGYQYPAIPNLSVTMQFRDRCDNELIKEWELTTDSNGYVSTSFKGTLEQKEYEVSVFSKESSYNHAGLDYTHFIDLDSWSALAGYYTYYSESVEDGGIKIEIEEDATYTYLTFDPSGLSAWPWDSVDHIYINMETNASIDYIDRMYSYDNPNTGLYAYDTTNYDIETSLTEVISLRISDWEDYDLMVGEIPYLRLHFSITAYTAYTFYFESLRYISAQKGYFTPSVTGSLYYDDQINDDWDFSVYESDSIISTVNVEHSVKDGLLNSTCTASHTSYYLTSLYTVDGWDISEYDTISFRVKALGETETFRLLMWDGTTTQSQITQDISVDYFTVFEYELSYFTNVDLTTIIKIHSYYGNGTDWHTCSEGDGILTDWIKVTKYDSSLSGGYAQEFEEPDYLEECEASSSSISVTGGNLLIETTGEYDGVFFRKVETDIYSQGLTKILLKAKTDQSSSQRFYLSIMEFNHTYIDLVSNTLYLTDEFQIFEMTLAESFGCFRLLSYTGTTTAQTVSVDWIKIVSDNPPNSFETPSSYFMSSENDTLQYQVFNDEQLRGSYTDLELINLNLSVSSHTFSYVAYNDLDTSGAYLPSAFYYQEYTVAETDLCSIIIHDQEGSWIDARNFIVEIDSTRIYGDTFLVDDTSSTFNLTISDFWGNSLYQDLSETWERFIDLQLTLYSVKVWNTQNEPIFLEITNGATWDEWVMPNEVCEYLLYSDTYAFKIYYSETMGDFNSSNTNGTTVTYNYAVSSDTALVVTGVVIYDVYNNLVALTEDADLTNISIHAALDFLQTNFTIELTAQTVAIYSNFTSVLAETANIVSNITDINANIINLLSNTTYILAELGNIDISLASNFTNFYTNFTTIYSDLLTINSSIAAEFLEVYSNTTYIIAELINIYGNITAVNISIITELLNVYAGITFEIEQLPEYFCVIKLIDPLGKSINILDFNAYYSEDNIDWHPLGDNTLLLYSNDSFYFKINDTWGATIFSQLLSFEAFIEISINIYELMLVNQIDERCEIRIKKNDSSTWLTLWLAEDSWRILQFYAGNYDIQFRYEDNTIFRSLEDQVLSSSLILEVKNYPDLVVYNYDYSYNPSGEGNMSLEVLANYEEFNVSVWDNGVYEGQWSSHENITWSLNSANGSYTVVFEVSRWITKVTNETQSRIFVFTYSIGEINELQATCQAFHDQTSYNVSISTNTHDAAVSIYHDGVFIVYNSLDRNFLFAKNGEIGLHNITIRVSYVVNSSLTWSRYWTYTYFVDGYKQAFRFSTNVDGFNLDNAYISLDYLSVYLDGVYIKPASPAWFEEPAETTNEVNNSCVDGGFVWVSSTVRLHTVTVKDLWGQTIDTLTIDLFNGSYVTYSLPLYKLTLLNDTDEERGYRLSKYTDSTGLYDALEIVSIPANSLHTIWIVDTTYQVRFYDAIERTIYESGELITYREWEYSDDGPIYVNPDPPYIWIHIPFSKYTLGEEEGEGINFLAIGLCLAALIIGLGALGYYDLKKELGRERAIAAVAKDPVGTGMTGGVNTMIRATRGKKKNN